MSDYKFKIIVIGDAGVGKTSLVSRFAGLDVSESYMATIGVEVNSTLLTVNERVIKLQFWDTAGQETFSSMIKNYYKGVVGVYLVVDLTNKTSIRRINYWLQEFIENKTEGLEAKIIVLGNKADSLKRKYTKEEMERITKRKNLEYIETSALYGLNTKTPVEYMGNYIYTNIDLENHEGITNMKNKSIDLLKTQEPSCCAIV
tara:strand:+ start:2229 stop:2834 length:606 start_codon:yes stop_codon:yes gene_type:complete